MDWPHDADDARPTSSPTLNDLMGIARRYGYRLHVRHLDDPEKLAVTNVDAGEITLRFDLTPVEQRSVFAHEIGHAHYGHDCSTPRNEREADAWAANLLVDPAAYAALEREGHDAHAIAEHLDVTIEVVHDFQRYCLQRLGRMTYGIRHRGRLTNPLARGLA